MKTIIERDLREAVLAEWRGAHAKIWIFDVTLVRVAIRLYRVREPELIYVVGVGCDHITGPFWWKDADIQIKHVSLDPENQAACRVIDTKAGFELSCSDAIVLRGPSTDFGKSFDNFLGETDNGA